MPVSTLNLAQIVVVSAINCAIPSLWKTESNVEDDRLTVLVYSHKDLFGRRKLLAEVTFDEENELILVSFRDATAIQKEILDGDLAKATKYPVYRI